jgi:hypothetical protein
MHDARGSTMTNAGLSVRCRILFGGNLTSQMFPSAQMHPTKALVRIHSQTTQPNCAKHRAGARLLLHPVAAHCNVRSIANFHHKKGNIRDDSSDTHQCIDNDLLLTEDDCHAVEANTQRGVDNIMVRGGHCKKLKHGHELSWWWMHSLQWPCPRLP